MGVRPDTRLASCQRQAYAATATLVNDKGGPYSLTALRVIDAIDLKTHRYLASL